MNPGAEITSSPLGNERSPESQHDQNVKYGLFQHSKAGNYKVNSELWPILNSSGIS